MPKFLNSHEIGHYVTYFLKQFLLFHRQILNHNLSVEYLTLEIYTNPNAAINIVVVGETQ
ncbi:MAG: hypothetical protein M1344_02960 [Candidatus Thermoplasmatota archaeon]|nr:hypothetical protein [Candidatus Thermoplasmatota archaeon]